MAGCLPPGKVIPWIRWRPATLAPLITRKNPMVSFISRLKNVWPDQVAWLPDPVLFTRGGIRRWAVHLLCRSGCLGWVVHPHSISLRSKDRIMARRAVEGDLAIDCVGPQKRWWKMATNTDICFLGPWTCKPLISADNWTHLWPRVFEVYLMR